MQVSISHSNETLTRHRRRLQESAEKERVRAASLQQEGTANLTEAASKKDGAVDDRAEGERLKRESDRLRRNGREQSLRGLHRLADGSDRYSESFQRQEDGLGALKGSLKALETAAAGKGDALEKINAGLAEQAAANASQSTDLSVLEGEHQSSVGVTGEKQQRTTNLQENVASREGALEEQNRRVDDFLLAGERYEAGSETKQAGFESLKKAVSHRVGAEALGDARSYQELQKSWSETDAARHQETERKLYFSSLFESLKATAAQINAEFHQAAAQRGEMKADELDRQASQMKAQADALLGQARLLEYSGQHHVAVGRQMKCCPWTYCQGVMLEQQGLAELARAQEFKSQAAGMREAAQRKRLEAEAGRVKAEQAREVGEELEVTARGSETRAGILEDRSHSHGERATEQVERAERADGKAKEFGRAASAERRRAGTLKQRGLSQFRDGMSVQRQALSGQGEAAADLRNSVAEEAVLQEQASSEVAGLAENLATGRSYLSRGKKLLEKLRGSVSSEVEAQGKVRSGIDDFESDLAASVDATTRGRKAAEMLEEARTLELEGLRLQNRGQKMLLEARPKMANAARLSAESFDAFKRADSKEEEAEALISQGHQKLSAAAILREKAEAYQSLVESA